MFGSGWETLPDVREAFPDVRSGRSPSHKLGGLLECPVLSGGYHRCPRVVWRPSRMSRSCRRPSRMSGMVGRLSRMSASG